MERLKQTSLIFHPGDVPGMGTIAWHARPAASEMIGLFDDIAGRHADHSTRLLAYANGEDQDVDVPGSKLPPGGYEFIRLECSRKGGDPVLIVWHSLEHEEPTETAGIFLPNGMIGGLVTELTRVIVGTSVETLDRQDVEAFLRRQCAGQD